MPVSIALIDSAPQTSAGATFTFAGLGFGAAASDRDVYAAIMARGLGASASISSVTIGGVSATPVHTQTVYDGSATDIVAFYRASVPSGTSGTVGVTFGASMLRCAVASIRVTGALAAPYATADDPAGAGDPTLSISAPAGGAILACTVKASSTSVTWAGLSELLDAVMASNTTYSVAGDPFASAATPTVTADYLSGAGSGAVMVAVALSPSGAGASVSDLITNWW